MFHFTGTAFRLQAVGKDFALIGETNRESGRPLRADARRKFRALLYTAMDVFATSGVDAPVREIAAKAGVGLGTVYRHFPKRSDLIMAVVQNEVDACADEAASLAAEYEPGEAVARWALRFVDFLATKRRLAAAIYSGDDAYSALPSYFSQRLQPALHSLLQAAIGAGVIRSDVESEDLLQAIVTLCRGQNDEHPPYARKMVELLIDGLRYRNLGATGASD